MNLLLKISFIALILSSCGQNDKTFIEYSESKTGIDFNNYLEETNELNVLNYTYFYNGSGVATGDLNNDGLTDVVFTGNMVRNKIFINKGGLKFEDITTASGIAEKQGWCTGITLVDINSDGWLDIYICRSADIDPERRANLLFINNKDLTFTEQAALYGLADKGYSTQSAFFDFDRDGDLDAVVVNHSLKKYTTGVSDNPGLRAEENAYFATKLYRNDGGHFIDVSKSVGVTSNVLSFGLSVAVSDFNNDEWPDFFISNDFNEPDYLFINQRDGTFKEEGSNRLSQHSLYSMGADAADIDHNGLTDLITLDMLPESNFDQKMHSGAENFEKFRYLFSKGFHNQYSRNMLHVNNGNGHFSEIGQLAGISNTDWSWSALLKDFDNDGNNDLFVTNGYVRDYTDMDFIKYSFDHQMEKKESGAADESMIDYIKKMPGHPMRNYMFRNEGNYQFKNVSKDWGFNREAVYSGASCADLDGDGDLDLVTSVTNGKAGVFINQTSQESGNNYIRFSFQGEGANIMGIGAVVKVYAGKNLQLQENYLSRGFQSSMEPIMHFGIGKANKIDSVVVNWPDGRRQILLNPSLNMVNILKQSNASKIETKLRMDLTPIYREQSNLSFGLRDRYQNDFSVRTSLNNFISNVSPIIKLADLNRDGLDDLIIGATRAQPTQIKFGNGVDFGKIDSLEDFNQNSVSAMAVADLNSDGYPEIIAGRNTFGDPSYAQSTFSVYMNQKGKGFKALTSQFPEIKDHIGSIAVDYDSLESVTRIFVGIRLLKDDYPKSIPSKVLVINKNGKFIREESLKMNRAPDMVTASVFVDIDADKKNELVTVGEFAPLNIFYRNDSIWTENSSSVSGLPGNGWWCSLFKSDLDGDGDEDLIAGNYGLNTQFKVGQQTPISILSKDFDGNGKMDAITSYYIEGISYPSHSLDDLLEQLPSLRKRYYNYSEYAKANTNSLFNTAERNEAMELKATEMRTMLLENTGKGSFVQHILPIQAQFAPVFAIAAIDIDRNGTKDLIFGGNQSGTRIKYGKYDANKGFIFMNNGLMKFSFESPSKTGINLNGDVRSIVVNRQGTKIFFGVNGERVHVFSKK